MRDLIAKTARRHERSLMQMTYHIIDIIIGDKRRPSYDQSYYITLRQFSYLKQ